MSDMEETQARVRALVDVLARTPRITHPIAVVAINGQEWRP